VQEGLQVAELCESWLLGKTVQSPKSGELWFALVLWNQNLSNKGGRSTEVQGDKHKGASRKGDNLPKEK